MTDATPAAAQPPSFEEFVRARSAHLMRLALLLTAGDRPSAEDLLQSALERTWRRRWFLRSEASPEPYVRRALVNAAIDWRRSKGRRRETELEAIQREPAVADGTGNIDNTDFVVRCLAQLPPRQRAVLVLRYWEQLSESEIASTMNCKVGTVKSQLSRGLERLRDLTGLKDQPGDQDE